MKLMPRCRMDGAYGYKPTTLSTDVIEIGNEDELYAKLPLGAYGLEGELARSGRLAVLTTVAGQTQLQQFDFGAERERGADCEGATHVISAMSVGAFRLVSGGTSRAEGSASALGAEVGGASRQSERVVKRAGDPNACATAEGETPTAQCNSPIQVFLEPLRWHLSGAEATQAAQEAQAKRDGVHIAIAPMDPSSQWLLKNAKDKLICETPCSTWLGPNSGAYLERDMQEFGPGY